VSGVLGTSSWVVWIHEEPQLDLFNLGEEFFFTEGGKGAEDLESLLMAIL
jgi:hypothetical protein